MSPGPIAPDLLANVRDALRKVDAAIDLCRKGQKCGYDMSGDEAVAQAFKSRLQAILQEFGPKKVLE